MHQFTQASQLRRFLGSTLAATAVEFAFIAPVSIVLAVGTLELGLITYTFISAQSASRDVARRLSMNQITISQANSIATSELPGWASSYATVSVSQSAPTDPSSNQYTVLVSIPAKRATPTNVLSWAYGSVTLKASVTMPQEPTS